MPPHALPFPRTTPPRPSQPFSAAEFAGRRQRILERLETGAVAVVQGAPAPRGFDVFRQTNEFYYLSGIETPHAYLLIDARDGRSILFLPPRDPRMARSEGETLSADQGDDATTVSGVDEVRPLAELATSLQGAAVVYAPLAPAEGSRQCRDTLRHAETAAAGDPWDGRIARGDRFVQRLRDALPGAEIRDLSPWLDGLRLVKSPAEIAVMRRAGQLTGQAVAQAMRCAGPGVVEYELGAVADYLFLLAGARGGGYRPIIAGGDNAWYPHYYRNNARLQAGDLILMDYAPDLDYYTSDIGRMWPVAGRYTAEQRALYGFMVEYHQALLRRIRPGVTPEDVLRDAAGEMAAVAASWPWARSTHAEAARRTLEFSGHLSHPVGMAVHDPGDYRGRAMEPGLVFAVDPQMWIPEERLYIRVEDTVVVAAEGVEILTTGAPLELDAVERWLAAAAEE